MRRKHEKGIRYLSVVLGVALVMGLFTGNIDIRAKTTIKDLEKQQQESKNRIEKAQQAIKDNNAELAQKQAEVLAAEAEIEKVNQAIFQVNNQIAEKELEIEQTKIKLEETKLEQMVYHDQTKDRIKVMYEYGDTQYLEVLFEAKDTSDFFNRLEYLGKLVEYDKGILDKIQRTKEEIEQYEADLVLEKIELEELQAENTIKLNEVEQLRADKANRILEINNNQTLLEEQIKAEEEEQKEIDKMIAKIIEENKTKMKLGDGSLDWPMPGWTRISSKFGPRTHPVWETPSYHTGIDIPASYGAGIKVSASGQVIFAGWGAAYGNYVLVDHGVDKKGRRIITQYAHCSTMLVVKDDVVVRGDVIAKIGSTGWSTGNHLHFGVQRDGTWVDPLNYVIPK